MALTRTVKRATSKNLNPDRVGEDQKPSGSKVITGLPPSMMLRHTPEKAIKRARQVRIIKRYSGTTGTGVATLRFVTKSKKPKTSHIPPQHDTLVKLVGPGKVWVSCGCENFCFQWEYALKQYGASSIIHSNGEPASVTNPANIPGLCLHLYKVLSLKSTMDRLDEIIAARRKRAAKERATKGK